MRRIVLAPSFDAEFFAISLHIDVKFGSAAADALEERFRRMASTLAHSPKIGTTTHGYPTGLYGFVMSPSWVFYRFDDKEIVFLHIRDGRMDKEQQTFG
jgi:plasmid stabilization system protein ParE